MRMGRPHTGTHAPCLQCGASVYSQIACPKKYCSLVCYRKHKAITSAVADYERHLKRCARCKEYKPFEAFPLARKDAGAHGRQAYCTPCGVAINAEWKKAHPRERKAIAQRAYWSKPEVHRARKRNLTLEQRAIKNAKAKAYREKNKDKIRIWNKLRVHRQRGNGPMPNRWFFGKLFCGQDARCVYCRVMLTGKYHIDHKTPLSRGGTNAQENLQLLCQTCNLKKHTMTHKEYRKSRRPRQAMTSSPP